MSNTALQLLTIALAGLHAGVLALVATRRARTAVLWLVGADALAVLAWMLLHPKPFHPPMDWPVVLFAAFEALVLVTVAMALKGVRIARRVAMLALLLHAAASGLALVFALTFRMSRLI